MLRTRSDVLTRLGAALGLLLLSGCATTTGSGGTKTICSVMQPIAWSMTDSDETIRQAKANNAVWTELCGKLRK